MSTGFGIAIMMNNYFHDVATALLMTSGFVMWVIVRKMEKSTDEQVIRYFLRIYGSVTRFARFSLLWILIGGVPRVLAYKQFEWANALGKSQVPALIVKHILAFLFVGLGVYLWVRLSRRVKEIKQSI